MNAIDIPSRYKNMNSMLGLQSFDSFQGDRITIDCIEIQCDMII